jgi:Putative lumazine-binding
MDITVRMTRWVTFRYTSLAGSLPRRLRSHVMAICFAVGIPVGCSGRQSETAVMAPVQAMFDGMAHRDAAAIKASWLPGGVLVVVVEGNLRQITVENFANRVATSGTTHIEEQIHDPQVRIDHDLAVVWAPFNFFIEGKLDHCGRDIFSLDEKNGRWQIVALAATTRRDCAAN